MTTILDDQDTSVDYVGVWQHGGGSAEFKETTTSTNAKGATATLIFSGEVLHFFSAVEQ